MTTTTGLFHLTAADLMSRNIVAIPLGMSLRAAAHRLAQAGVSGAPVVDEFGRCMGVLSKTDLVRYLDQGGRPTCECSGKCMFADWQMTDLEALPGDDVSRFMTTNVVTAPPETPIAALARLMYDAHIHRVLIADTWGKVVGIVSSLDILGALAHDETGTAE
jgi:CBS-domain-containing membrane protein